MTASTAGRSRSAARATSGEWNAPETFSLTVSVLAGDDYLPGTVVVRRPDPEDPAADALDDLVLEAEDRGHRAGALPRRLGHRQAPFADKADRLGDTDGVGGRQRGELADGVADHVVGLDPARAQGGEHRQARGHERRLLHLGLNHLLQLGVEAETPQVEPTGFASAQEDGHRLGHSLGDVTSHSPAEGTLSRKAEGDLGHLLLRPVHYRRTPR